MDNNLTLTTDLKVPATGSPSGSDAMSMMSADIGDWHIDFSDIVIVKRADGTDWMLGDGAFGQVCHLHHLLTVILQGSLPVEAKPITKSALQSSAADIIKMGGWSVFQNKVTMLTAHGTASGTHEARDSSLQLWCTLNSGRQLYRIDHRSYSAPRQL